MKYAFLSFQDPNTNEVIPVFFDIVSTQSYEAAMAITGHPVEKGAPIVDHARPEPITLSFEAFVTDTPLPSNLAPFEKPAWDFLPTPLDYSGANPNVSRPPLLTPGGLTQAVASLVSPEPPLPKQAVVFRAKNGWYDRARYRFEQLTFARTNRLFITVNTRVGQIDHMLIEHIAVERNLENAGGIAFQIGLKQVRVVSSQFVTYPKPAEPRAAPEVKKGAQQAESFAWQAGDALGAWRPQ